MSRTVLPRSVWTGTPEGFSRRLVAARVGWVAVHYPGTSAAIGVVSQERAAALLRGYRNYHVNGRGWADIGYCYAVDQAGRVYSAAGDRVAAHSASKGYPEANHEGIGVLLLIGNTETPTPELVASFNWLVGVLKGKFPNITKVMGHRQVRGAATSCPGDKTIALIGNGTLGLKGSTTAPYPAPVPTPPAKKPTVREWPDTALAVTSTLGLPARKAYQRLLAPASVGDYRGWIDGDLGPLTIRAEQQWLARLGYYKGRIDGVRGPMTRKALQAFLYDKGLYRNGTHSKTVMCDGILGTRSNRALITYLNTQRRYYQ